MGREASSWCEVDAESIKANVAALRHRLAPGAQLGIVVKSNAYGHGLWPCAGKFIEAGADWLIVNSAVEAEALRRRNIVAPIYICGPVFPDEAQLIADSRASVAISEVELVKALAQAGCQAGQRIGVHIKVETGTHRQGVSPTEAVALGRAIEGMEGVVIEGLTTHYADIEDTTDHTFALGQLRLLEEAERGFREAGLEVLILHSANSAATLLWPQTHAGLVRVGIAAYGLWPSSETYATALERQLSAEREPMSRLRPVLSWKARIAQVKAVPEGGYIGYGRTFRATHPMRIALLPVGYYEGYDRRLSNVGHVLVNGVRAPVRGRVCMNMAMIDVTHIPRVERGTVATLLGRDGEEEISAQQWANWMGSIHYEAVSRIHPDQPRFLRRSDGTLERGESNG